MFALKPYFFPLAVLLLLLALAVPSAPVWYDDAGHYLVIDHALETGSFAYPTFRGPDPHSPFITLGAPLNHLYRAWMQPVGGMAWARILTVLLTLVASFGFYRWGKSLFGPKKAAWALWIMVGNVQLVMYGAQVLGELPMVAGMMVGLWGAAEWQRTGKWSWLGLLVVAWWWAVGCKAYIAVPLGVALLGVAGVAGVRREWKMARGWCAAGAAWVLLVTAGLVLEQGGWDAFLNYLEVRRSYGNEFFTLRPQEALRYLAFKPLFWLGMIALALRWRFHPRSADRLPLLLQISLTLFFLLSAGYDRFGFLLLFIPALYVAEFAAALWDRWQGKVGLRAVFILLFILLFVQQTPYLLASRLLDLDTTNQNEKAAVARLEALGATSASTYDQQLVPFAGLAWRLPTTVPSNKVNCEPIVDPAGGYFVAGAYAFTEYVACIDWNAYTSIDTIGAPPLAGYVIYRRRR